MQDTNSLIIEKIGTIVIPGHVPSINDFNRKANHNHFDGGKFEKEWKLVGFLAANQWILNNPGSLMQPLSGGVWVVIRVYRHNNIRRDVHNLFAKPILDGFTQAGLWVDDNEKVVPKVTFEYCGVDKENPRVEFCIFQEQEAQDNDAT
jgi:Holliday junction resolvase RusA-like endonuclease